MASDRSYLSRYRCLTMCLLATAGGAAALLSAATAARRIRYLTVARSRYVSPRFVARGATPLPVVFASAASVTAPKPPLQPTLLEWWTTERAAIAPGLVLYVVHSVLRDAMARCGISFPASIVGMLAGFAVLMAARAVRAEAAETLARFLEPAARLFRSWLAALFAPGLITLPLVMPSLPARELALFFVLSAGGFFVSVATGAMIAAAFAPRKLQVSGAPSGDCCVTQPLDIPAAAPPPLGRRLHALSTLAAADAGRVGGAGRCRIPHERLRARPHARPAQHDAWLLRTRDDEHPGTHADLGASFSSVLGRNAACVRRARRAEWARMGHRAERVCGAGRRGERAHPPPRTMCPLIWTAGEDR